jgi:hypothetical protein
MIDDTAELLVLYQWRPGASYHGVSREETFRRSWTGLRTQIVQILHPDHRIGREQVNDWLKTLTFVTGPLTPRVDVADALLPPIPAKKNYCLPM